MQGQELVQELEAQAGLLANITSLLKSHNDFLAEIYDKRRHITPLFKMMIAGVLLGGFISILTHWNALILIVLALIVMIAYYFMNHKKKIAVIDNEAAQENAEYEEKRSYLVNQLNKHVRLNLPLRLYISQYLLRLAEIIGTNQADDFGTAIRILEDRLRLEENTAVTKDAANRIVSATNEVAKSVDETKKEVSKWGEIVAENTRQTADNTREIANDVQGLHRDYDDEHNHLF